MPADPSVAPTPRRIAGLWCTDVLARLPDYLDAELTEDDRAAVEAHLADCRWCTEFGGRYAGIVQGIQARLAAPAPVPDDVADRLDAALDAALDGAP